VTRWYEIDFITLVTANVTMLVLAARTRALWLGHGLRAGLVAMLFLGPCACTFNAAFLHLDGPTPQEGEQRAEPFIAALEQYRQERGTYPLQLPVPEHMGHVPRPSRFSSYEYVTFPSSRNRQRYELSFLIRGDADTWDCYSSETKAWVLHDSNC
jgi:hypothetical protein